VDETIIFHPLDRTQIRKIVDLQIERLKEILRQQTGLALQVTERARDRIAVEGYDPTYGARPLKRVIQQRLQNPLASEILKGEFQEGTVVKIDCPDGQFTFETVAPGDSATQIETESVTSSPAR
jgi:ATP-dependent Clp protease ATP-binding subunit ClpB